MSTFHHSKCFDIIFILKVTHKCTNDATHVVKKKNRKENKNIKNTSNTTFNFSSSSTSLIFSTHSSHHYRLQNESVESLGLMRRNIIIQQRCELWIKIKNSTLVRFSFFFSYFSSPLLGFIFNAFLTTRKRNVKLKLRELKVNIEI